MAPVPVIPPLLPELRWPLQHFQCAASPSLAAPLHGNVTLQSIQRQMLQWPLTRD